MNIEKKNTILTFGSRFIFHQFSYLLLLLFFFLTIVVAEGTAYIIKGLKYVLFHKIKYTTPSIHLGFPSTHTFSYLMYTFSDTYGVVGSSTLSNVIAYLHAIRERKSGKHIDIDIQPTFRFFLRQLLVCEKKC